MESQVEVLEGKRRALARHRDVDRRATPTPWPRWPAMPIATPQSAARAARRPQRATAASVVPPAVSRLVLSAQEDLRREIARAMHDGPAQSLTNIVLQAQIVERLVAKDPALALGRGPPAGRRWSSSTLEATKTFIFDVRPMVLDDLGLVPTLRRAARERGRKAGVAVEFDSMGQDRRLPMDLESGLFRILDEALVGYLGRSPDRGSRAPRLGRPDRGAGACGPGQGQATPKPAAEPAAAVEAPPTGAELPPALAAMMEDRRADARDAAETARRDVDRRPARHRRGGDRESGRTRSASWPTCPRTAPSSTLVAEAPVPTER